MPLSRDRSFLRGFLLASAALALTACNLANLVSQNRTIGVGTIESEYTRVDSVAGEEVDSDTVRSETQGRIVTQDAKGRVVTVNEQEFRTNDPTRPYMTRRIICSEPSPDALSAVSAALYAEGRYEEAAAAAASASLSEQVGSIGIRTPAVQSLRDAMFRICEAYSAGGLQPNQYRDLLTRYQNVLLAVLAVEQLTGIAQAAPIALNSSAAASGSNVASLELRLGQLQDELDTTNGRIKDIDAQLEGASDETEKAPLQSERNRLDEKRKRLERDITELKAQVARGGIAVASSGNSEFASGYTAGRSGGQTQAEVARAVAAIVGEVIHKDNTDDVCLAFYSDQLLYNDRATGTVSGSTPGRPGPGHEGDRPPIERDTLASSHLGSGDSVGLTTLVGLTNWRATILASAGGSSAPPSQAPAPSGPQSQGPERERSAYDPYNQLAWDWDLAIRGWDTEDGVWGSDDERLYQYLNGLLHYCATAAERNATSGPSPVETLLSTPVAAAPPPAAGSGTLRGTVNMTFETAPETSGDETPTEPAPEAPSSGAN